MSIPDKRPRHYAAEIIALPTRAARAAALDTVPAIIRDWVRHLVEDHFAKRAHLARRAPDTSAPKYPTPAPPKAPATGEPVAGRAALSRLREVLA